MRFFTIENIKDTLEAKLNQILSEATHKSFLELKYLISPDYQKSELYKEHHMGCSFWMNQDKCTDSKLREQQILHLHAIIFIRTVRKLYHQLEWLDSRRAKLNFDLNEAQESHRDIIQLSEDKLDTLCENITEVRTR